LSGINSHFLNFIPTVNSEIFSYLERGKTPIFISFCGSGFLAELKDFKTFLDFIFDFGFSF